jgi:response regulator RpfG family c-di-GMP phosphodiesterase
MLSDARVTREKDRLAVQREEAEEALEEAMARLRRIRKQEQQLREKAAEMVAMGVESLEELESYEATADLARVQNEEQQLFLDADVAGGVDAAAWNAIFGVSGPSSGENVSTVL